MLLFAGVLWVGVCAQGHQTYHQDSHTTSRGGKYNNIDSTEYWLTPSMYGPFMWLSHYTRVYVYRLISGIGYWAHWQHQLCLLQLLYYYYIIYILTVTCLQFMLNIKRLLMIQVKTAYYNYNINKSNKQTFLAHNKDQLLLL